MNKNYLLPSILVLLLFSSSYALSTAYAQVNNPPTVTIEDPADGSTFAHLETILFKGIASDPEDGSLTFFIDWSSDVDGHLGTGWLFSKILSDGDHTITASVTDSGGLTGVTTINITVGNGPINFMPAVTISSPTSLSEFTEGDSILFSATATDVEDGDIGSNLTWTSDLDGTIGNGSSFNKSNLSVGQRISAQYHLNPLSQIETREYIAHRIRVAQGDPKIFVEGVAEMVCEHTGGVPRLINTLCDSALLYGYSEDRHFINEEIVREALKDKIKYGPTRRLSGFPVRGAHGSDRPLGSFVR